MALTGGDCAHVRREEGTDEAIPGVDRGEQEHPSLAQQVDRRPHRGGLLVLLGLLQPVALALVLQRRLGREVPRRDQHRQHRRHEVDREEPATHSAALFTAQREKDRSHQAPRCSSYQSTADCGTGIAASPSPSSSLSLPAEELPPEQAPL